eukprot:scaffold487805_cov18-Prasinocladus_malaysianus.AAC.1
MLLFSLHTWIGGLGTQRILGIVELQFSQSLLHGYHALDSVYETRHKMNVSLRCRSGVSKQRMRQEGLFFIEYTVDILLQTVHVR